MYAIAQVIYGVPLVGVDSIYSTDLLDAIENNGPGFLSYYSGSSEERPAAFGIEMDQFDEACGFVDVSGLKLEPTKDQLAEFQKLFAAQPPALQKEIEDYGKPRVFFLWSTS